MSIFRVLDISGSGLTAQRMRLDTIAQNIANASTTRTNQGTPYRRRVVQFQSRDESSFAGFLSKASQSQSGNGVRVIAIREDPSPMKQVYDPDHPDADDNGYLMLPNVDTTKELIDMISAGRSYEANVTVLNTTKSLILKTLEIGR